MVTIRLARRGTKKRPFYHIVVADSRRSTTGRFIEKIGFFGPVLKNRPENLSINTDRIKYWMSKGVPPSKRVCYLVRKNQNIAENLLRSQDEILDQ